MTEGKLPEEGDGAARAHDPPTSTEPGRRWKRAGLQILSWTVAGSIVGLLLWWMDIGEVVARLREATPWPVAAGLAMVSAVFFMQGTRWWIITRELGTTRPGMTIRLMLFAIFLNVFIPLRGGDVARGLLVARETGLAKSTSLGTVALDKLFDMMVIIVLIAPLPFVGGLPEWLRWPPVLTVVLAFGLLALGFALRSGMRRRGEKVEKAGWIVRTLAGLVRGMDCMALGWPPVYASLLSIGTMVMLVGAVGCVLWSVGIEPTLGRAIVTVFAVQFSASIPLTPSSAGTMHAAITAALMATGVDRDSAMTAAIIFHAVQNLPIVVLGGFAARRTAFKSFSQLQDEIEEQRSTLEPRC